MLACEYDDASMSRLLRSFPFLPRCFPGLVENNDLKSDVRLQSVLVLNARDFVDVDRYSFGCEVGN
jgi:hypothetical protein